MDLKTIRTFSAATLTETPPPNHRMFISASLVSGAIASSAAANSDIVEQYNSIKDPCDKVSFYRENKRCIDRFYRDAPEHRAAPKPSGNEMLDQMNKIADGAKRTAFYRQNKAAIDAHFRTNHEHH